MSKLRLNMMMSLDGYSAGPEQSAENPFGIGGMQLNEWIFPLRAFRPTTIPSSSLRTTPVGRWRWKAAPPVFLAGGTRLFDDLGTAPRRPEQLEVIEAPGVTHLRYQLA